MRVLVAMSGGVDSSVAAARMVDAGHDVVGVHLALSSAPGTLRTGSRGCCSKEDAGDARRVADMLDIPFYVWDFADRFKEDVIDDFVSSYARGETPNPCVRCNERIKFSALSARALALGSTPSPPATTRGCRTAGCGAPSTRDKDQSYVLGVLTAEQLRHALFPIGDTPKPQIREEAARRGLAVADKPDSHDICFIPSGDTRAFLGSRIGVRRGTRGRRGRHGARRTRRRARLHHRPAQGPRHRRARPRRAPPLCDRHRRRHRDGARRRRRRPRGVVADRRSSPCSPRAPRRAGPWSAQVQVRAHGGIADAVAEVRDGDLVVDLRAPLRGVAAGQTMVLYRPDADGDEVIGSATIARTRR